MGWKNWPSWVKGGIIGIIISLFAVFIVYLIGGFEENYLFYIIQFPIIPAWYIFAFIFDLMADNGPYIENLIFLKLIFGFAFGYAIYGIFIGWLIGKIKSKKEEIK